MIAAIGANNVIGRDGALPWRLPSDLAFYKQTTMGKPIVMGRRTYESIGRPLPGRTNIVVSRNESFRPDGVLTAADLDAAIELAKSIAAADGVDEIVIVGGETIYRQAMAYADRLYVTHVDVSPEGDAYFPRIASDTWAAVDAPDIPGSERDSAGFAVRVYERRGVPAD